MVVSTVVMIWRQSRLVYTHHAIHGCRDSHTEYTQSFGGLGKPPCQIRDGHPYTMVFVDSKKTDLSCYENCIIKVNELEYSKVTKGPIKSQMIVTLGSRGAKWMEDPERIYEPKEQVDVFDVCGAGDTFMSALVTAYMSTFSMPESINFANRCAGISVKNFGNYTVSLEDIK